MNKNIFLGLFLVFSILGLGSLAEAKDGSDDNKVYSSSSDDSSSNGLEIEADIFTNETIVKVEINDVKSTFTTKANTRAQIAAEVMAKNPSLTMAQIEAGLKIENENRASRSDDSDSDKDDDSDDNDSNSGSGSTSDKDDDDSDKDDDSDDNDSNSGSGSESDKNDDSDDDDNKGEEHRSAVAGVVLNLKEVADKDKKVSEEIKKVAKEQSESAEKAAKAMESIQKRSGFKVFFIGTDFKNLGDLRSEMVTTDNSIDNLMKALEKATDPSVKASLELEIKALEAEKLKVDTFIESNESKFSLFGWLVKLFNK